MNIEERLNELEARLAFYDDAQQTLDHALIEQQKQIRFLEQKVERLTRDLTAMHNAAPGLPAELEPPPPHY